MAGEWQNARASPGDVMKPEADNDTPDGMQTFHQRSAGRVTRRSRWEPPRWFGLLGALWIVIVGGLWFWQSPVIWKVAGVIWCGIGLIHMAAWWLEKREEWGRVLDRLYWIGAVVVLILFGIVAATQLGD